MSPAATSTQLLNSFRDDDSTTVLFQCLITLSGKEFSFLSNLNIVWHNLRLLPLFLQEGSILHWDRIGLIGLGEFHQDTSAYHRKTI